MKDEGADDTEDVVHESIGRGESVRGTLLVVFETRVIVNLLRARVYSCVPQVREDNISLIRAVFSDRGWEGLRDVVREDGARRDVHRDGERRAGETLAPEIVDPRSVGKCAEEVGV